MNSDSIRCWLPGPTICTLQRCSVVASKLIRELIEYISLTMINDAGIPRITWLSIIKPILPSRASLPLKPCRKWAQWSSRQSTQINTLFVLAFTIICYSVTFIFIVECSCTPIRPMEGLGIQQWQTSPCNVWAKQFVDFGLQSVRGCVARY